MMLPEFLTGFGMIIIYFAVCVMFIFLIRYLVNVPTEVFRKILHIVLLCSLLVWIYAFETWWVSVLSAVIFVVLLLPVLHFAEKINGYSELLTERKSGEIKTSFIIVFTMFAVMISVCWGWLGEKWLVIACVYAWGFGDAAAALIGKKFGKHYLEGRLIEGRKSVEGTLAMFVVSFFSVLIILLASGKVAPYGIVPIAAIAAAACAFVELYTRNGFDTVTCPIMAAAVILPLAHLWGI